MIRAGNDIRAALIRAGERVLVHDMAGRTRTAQQLIENVDRLAGALLARGAYGGKIGLWYRNSLSAVEASLAVEWIGGTNTVVVTRCRSMASRIAVASNVSASTCGNPISRKGKVPTKPVPCMICWAAKKHSFAPAQGP